MGSGIEQDCREIRALPSRMNAALRLLTALYAWAALDTDARYGVFQKYYEAGEGKGE